VVLGAGVDPILRGELDRRVGCGSSSAAGLEHETTDAAAMPAPTIETRSF
jgi:hypothetical protein